MERNKERKNKVRVTMPIAQLGGMIYIISARHRDGTQGLMSGTIFLDDNDDERLYRLVRGVDEAQSEIGRLQQGRSQVLVDDIQHVLPRRGGLNDGKKKGKILSQNNITTSSSNATTITCPSIVSCISKTRLMHIATTTLLILLHIYFSILSSSQIRGRSTSSSSSGIGDEGNIITIVIIIIIITNYQDWPDRTAASLHHSPAF